MRMEPHSALPVTRSYLGLRSSTGSLQQQVARDFIYHSTGRHLLQLQGASVLGLSHSVGVAVAAHAAVTDTPLAMDLQGQQ